MDRVQSVINWQRSAKCDSEAACVEVSFTGGEVLIRSSNHPDGPYIAFSTNEWRYFLAGAKANEFDV